MSSKIGLVLAGGGGKGSYQIGVWKFLREAGLDSKLSVISGTSAGGLNGFLIANGDFNTAEKIWTNELSTKILDTISQSHRNNSLFSRKGLLDIMDKYIDFSNARNFEKALYVTCYNMNKSKAEYIKLNRLSRQKIEKYLLATSAIPIVFENEKCWWNTYCDGGVIDNVPIRPLLDEKCTHAIIVNLNSEDKLDYTGYGMKSVVIKPSVSLGNFLTGTLNFSPVNAKMRIEQGYNDCKNIYAAELETLL